MSFDWLNYTILADELRILNCRGGVEARLRSSVSRGYYGIFHQIRLKLMKEGLQFGGSAEAHQEAVQALRTSPQRARFQMGVDIGRMRQYRNAADYQDHIDNVAEMEGESVKLRASIQMRITAPKGPA